MWEYYIISRPKNQAPGTTIFRAAPLDCTRSRSRWRWNRTRCTCCRRARGDAAGRAHIRTLARNSNCRTTRNVFRRRDVHACGRDCTRSPARNSNSRNVCTFRSSPASFRLRISPYPVYIIPFSHPSRQAETQKSCVTLLTFPPKICYNMHHNDTDDVSASRPQWQRFDDSSAALRLKTKFFFPRSSVPSNGRAELYTAPEGK